MMKPVMETKQLSCQFGEVTAVNQLSLTVYQGEVFGFLGHNGAGKTTTVRLLNGVLASSQGTARVLAMDPATEGSQLRRRTGVLTETPSLDERLTGRENLTIYAELYDVPAPQVNGRVRDLLHTFDLSDRADEKVAGYSKGMKQRLALARALLHDPEILFLDEPTSGLDPVATRQVHEMIRHLSREEGHTVFLCTHNLNEAQQLCDRVGVMENGRLIALGTPAELVRQMHKSLQMEIEVDENGREAAVNVITQMDGMQSQACENGTLTITGIEREQIPEMLAGLVEAGVRIYRANPQEPSLTDVYFTLHKENQS